MSLFRRTIRAILLILFASYLVTMMSIGVWLASTMVSKAFGGYSEAVSATKNALWMSVGGQETIARLAEFGKRNAYRYIGENVVNPILYTAETFRTKTISVTTRSPIIPSTIHSLSVSPQSVNFITIIRF